MSACYTGAEAFTTKESEQFGTRFLLDDLGCSGSKINLLDCLSQHNCGMHGRGTENAGVRCLRKGIS